MDIIKQDEICMHMRDGKGVEGGGRHEHGDDVWERKDGAGAWGG